MNNKFCCGIDVSKKKLDVVLLKEEKFHYKVFENSNEGVILLQEWIKNKLEKDTFVHFCMEATNVYHELVAFTLLENKNFKVSVLDRAVTSYIISFEEISDVIDYLLDDHEVIKSINIKTGNLVNLTA